MSIPKLAEVESVEVAAHDPDTRLVTLAPREPLGFVGGQYIIVDSGLVLPNGRSVKRAYSIASSDADQARFVLAVKRIAGGLGSAYLHQVQVGDEVRFSGPWGKLHTRVRLAGAGLAGAGLLGAGLPDAGLASAGLPDAGVPSAGLPSAGLPDAGLAGVGLRGRTLVLATDTGVTAALGLVLGRAFAPHLAETTFISATVREGDFLGEDWVRARLPEGLGRVRFERLPAVDSVERLAWARARLDAILEEGPLAQAFLAGDGAVNYALLDVLVERGVDVTRDHVESFFNMPKKAPSAQVAV